MNDNLIVLIKTTAMVVGGFVAGRGWASTDQVNSFVQELPTLISAATAFGAAVWAIWTRWNTKAVPADTAARADVPTVSAVTGAVTK